MVFIKVYKQQGICWCKEHEREKFELVVAFVFNFEKRDAEHRKSVINTCVVDKLYANLILILLKATYNKLDLIDQQWPDWTSISAIFPFLLCVI